MTKHISELRDDHYLSLLVPYEILVFLSSNPVAWHTQPKISIKRRGKKISSLPLFSINKSKGRGG